MKKNYKCEKEHLSFFSFEVYHGMNIDSLKFVSINSNFLLI